MKYTHFCAIRIATFTLVACGEACPATASIWRCDGVDALACTAAGGEVCANGVDDDCDDETDEADCIPGGG